MCATLVRPQFIIISLETFGAYEGVVNGMSSAVIFLVLQLMNSVTYIRTPMPDNR